MSKKLLGDPGVLAVQYKKATRYPNALPMTTPMLSAGVIPVRRFDGLHRYLLLRAYHNWDFPKGLVEDGEAPLQAAQREVEEETGLGELVFRWGQHYRETAPYGRGKIARYYLAEVPRGEVYLPVSAELGRPEHDEFRWVTYADARSLLVERLRPILDWAEGLISGGATPGDSA